MYKKKGVRKLGMTKSHREAIVKSQVRDLLERGFVRTTRARAKEVVRLLGMLADYAFSNNKNKLRDYLRNEVLVNKFVAMVSRGDSFKSGLATVVSLGNRVGDNADIVLVEVIKDRV